MVNLSDAELLNKNIPDEQIPSPQQRAEVLLTAVLCAFCQIFVALCLFLEILWKNHFNPGAEKVEAIAVVAPEIDNKSVFIVKFIASILFHVKFESEIRNALSMMKFAIMHSKMFKNNSAAFFMGFIDFTAIVGIEFVMLWNLLNIEPRTVYSLMFDFISLAIVAEFDDYFA